MLQILAITTPIYLIIAAGFLAVRFGLFTKPELRVLGRFVIQFCMPALIFRALSQRSLGEVLNLPYLLAYALGSLALLLGATLYGRRLRGQPMPLAAMRGLGMSASNSGFVGYPILLQLIGPAAGVALALCMVVENLLILPLSLVLADSGNGGAAQRWHQALQQTLRNLLSNPLILAILAGFGFALLGLQLPEVLGRTVQIMATAASPIALFVIGGTLVGLRLEGVRRDLACIAFGKLVLHPLAVLALLLVLPPIDPTLRLAAVMFAGMPMLSIYPVLAQKYHLEGLTAAALLVTTVLSFLSISLLLWALHTLLGWVP
ncbi:AEC family transporter [Rhodoferax sp.]|uniref:AEC family transporter n=1 Tax=Rhodoferax sp. TaxID=50421 RepID=UPI00374D2901